MKKLFITCILVGAFVPLFQNCGQQKTYGNGDPYEGLDPKDSIDIGPDYTLGENHGLPAQATLTRICTGGGQIKRVEIGELNGKEILNVISQNNSARLITNTNGTAALSTNFSFSSTVAVKSFNIFPNSVTIGVEISGVLVYEQLSCVVY